MDVRRRGELLKLERDPGAGDEVVAEQVVPRALRRQVRIRTHVLAQRDDMVRALPATAELRGAQQRRG